MRRPGGGGPTVHVRWNINTALLVGDILMGLAYISLLARGQTAQAPAGGAVHARDCSKSARGRPSIWNSRDANDVTVGNTSP